MPAPPRVCLSRLGLLALGLALGACPAPAPVAPQPARKPSGAPTTRDTLLDQRLARLELRVLEKEAQVADLDARLDEARREVVRAMAKLETVASRAEAASALAEAELALQTLRTAAGPPPGPNLAEATQLLQQGTAEFGKQNYGGALYLANQAKSVAGVGKGRTDDPGRPPPRPGETPLPVPLKLQAVTRGNVREGPGPGYPILFTVEIGTQLVGYSAVEPWVRVADETGRSGWIHVALVGLRGDGPR
jgi:uncharacterized coiled-coil protein SlyX